MSAVELSYAGIGNVTATFKLDEPTKTVFKEDLFKLVGKCVALTGNDTVGFGAEAGIPLFGIVEAVDARGLASVTVTGFLDNVPIKKFGGTPAFPAVGEIGLGVDNAGSAVKLAAGKRGVLTSIASTSGDTSIATILL